MYILEKQKGVLEESDIENVILLDTEGLGSMAKNTNFDMQLFSLSLLLSSMLIYNSVGTIDDSALENISYPFI